MKTRWDCKTLTVTDIGQLDGVHAASLATAVAAALPPGVRQLDVDLSQTTCLDCGGLGALLALRKRAQAAQAGLVVRLRNPPRPVRRLLRLTRADEVFTVVT